jgi:maleate cis-trans isomerase
MDPALSSRAKIGLIVPPNNTVNEAEWQSALPPGVSLHATRMRLNPLARTPEEMAVLRADLQAATALVAEAGVDVIAFGCTAPSAVNPRREMESMMAEAGGRPGATAGAAMADALLAVGGRRIVLLSPFSEAVTRHEAAFLAGEGIEVIAVASLGHQTYAPGRKLGIHLIGPAEIRAALAPLPLNQADVLMLSGTNLVTFPIIEALEVEIGRPVVSSNQALLWSALRRAGIADRLKLGRLFDMAAIPEA